MIVVMQWTSTSESRAMVLAAASTSSPPALPHARARARARTWRACPLSLQEGRGSARVLVCGRGKVGHGGRGRSRRSVPVRCEIAGQYEESFADVDKVRDPPLVLLLSDQCLL